MLPMLGTLCCIIGRWWLWIAQLLKCPTCVCHTRLHAGAALLPREPPPMSQRRHLHHRLPSRQQSHARRPCTRPSLPHTPRLRRPCQALFLSCGSSSSSGNTLPQAAGRHPSIACLTAHRVAGRHRAKLLGRLQAWPAQTSCPSSNTRSRSGPSPGKCPGPACRMAEAGASRSRRLHHQPCHGSWLLSQWAFMRMGRAQVHAAGGVAAGAHGRLRRTTTIMALAPAKHTAMHGGVLSTE